MMEFVLSRAAMVVCGAILLTAVAGPVSEVCSNGGSDEIDMLAQDDARIIDSFFGSEMDELRLDGSALLPSSAYSISIDGYFLTVYDGDGAGHSASLTHKLEPMTLSYGEVKTIFRNII